MIWPFLQMSWVNNNYYSEISFIPDSVWFLAWKYSLDKGDFILQKTKQELYYI